MTYEPPNNIRFTLHEPDGPKRMKLSEHTNLIVALCAVLTILGGFIVYLETRFIDRNQGELVLQAVESLRTELTQKQDTMQLTLVEKQDALQDNLKTAQSMLASSMLLVRKGQVEDQHTLMQVLEQDYGDDALFTSQLDQAQRRLQMLEDSLGDDISLDQLPFKLSDAATPVSLGHALAFDLDGEHVQLHYGPGGSLEARLRRSGLSDHHSDRPFSLSTDLWDENFCANNPLSCTANIDTSETGGGTL